MRKLTLAAVLLAVWFAMPAAAATTVVTDPCGTTPHEREGVDLPGQDICALDVATLQSGGDGPTTLELSVAVAGDPQQIGGNYIVAWRAGDCSFVAFYGDPTGAVDGSDFGLAVACGEPDRDCTPVLDTACDSTYDYEETFAVPGRFGPTSVTWTLTFEGELAGFAAAHADGATLHFGGAVAGPDVPGVAAPFAAINCSSEIGCHDLVGDWALTASDYVIGT